MSLMFADAMAVVRLAMGLVTAITSVACESCFRVGETRQRIRRRGFAGDGDWWR